MFQTTNQIRNFPSSTLFDDVWWFSQSTQPWLGHLAKNLWSFHSPRICFRCPMDFLKMDQRATTPSVRIARKAGVCRRTADLGRPVVGGKRLVPKRYFVYVQCGAPWSWFAIPTSLWYQWRAVEKKHDGSVAVCHINGLPFTINIPPLC